MKILAIETSCDETAISLIEAVGNIVDHEGKPTVPSFAVLESALFSQIDIHAVYGGVFPAIAKREHAKRIVPMVAEVLRTHYIERSNSEIHETVSGEKNLVEKQQSEKQLAELLTKEPEVLADLESHNLASWLPDIDAIAVTQGPGLEPALWVGLNTARALAYMWQKPLILANHMKGHIISPLLHRGTDPVFPALAVLISGGHTELVLTASLSDFSVIGKTRDDAIGEAYDKVARLLGMPYPGGAELSKLAAQARTENITPRFSLPRPMITSDDLDFSFSGIKTAVLYLIRDLVANGTIADEKNIDSNIKKHIALEFENAVADVLIKKITNAIETHNARTLLVGGGVIANPHLRVELSKLAESQGVEIYLPEQHLSTDNATMIGMAAYIDYLRGLAIQPSALLTTDIRADGNLKY